MPGYGGNPGWSFEYMQSDVPIIVMRAQLGVCCCICQGKKLKVPMCLYSETCGVGTQDFWRSYTTQDSPTVRVKNHAAE